jgi:glycosyltransferase involved in cell wall biosynthesis
MHLNAGGVDTCISDLIAYAPQGVGFAVVGATADPRVKLGTWQEVSHRGRSLEFLPVARLFSQERRRLPHSFQVARGLLRWRRRVPDLPVQVHRIDLAVPAMALRGAKRGYIQFVHNPHGRGEGVMAEGSDSFWRYAPGIYALCESRTIERADRVVVFSRREAERLREQGVPAARWRTWFDPATFAFISKPDRPADSIRIVSIGRLERQKDPLLALQGVAELKRRGLDVQATFIGGGALAPELERESTRMGLSDAVSFVGTKDRNHVAAALQSADVLLLTSHYEGSPRILIEALATGTPVAATVEADPDQLVVQGVTGSLARARHPALVADALMSAVDAPPQACLAAVKELRADIAVPRLIAETSVT